MVFKKTVFTQIKLKGKRPIDIKKVTEWNDNKDYNNDKQVTFDGNDPHKGIPDGTLTLNIRCDQGDELSIILENGMDDVDDDGCTVTILDGKSQRIYTGCFPDKVNPSHQSDGKPSLAIDLSYTEKTGEFLG